MSRQDATASGADQSEASSRDPFREQLRYAALSTSYLPTMTRLLLLALVGLLLAPAASAQLRRTGNLQPAARQFERQIGVQTGNVTTRNISGQPSDGAVTLMPGGNAVFFGAIIGERSDAPCHLIAYFWKKPTPQSDFEFVTEEYAYCGSTAESRRSSREYVGIGDSHAVQTSYWTVDGVSPYLGETLHAATGVQVCDNDRNQNNIRMKGLRFFGATVDRDGNRRVNGDSALTNTEERNHCREWRTAQTCPGQQVMVGLDVHYRADGNDPYSITAIAPKCAPLTIAAAQVLVSND